MKKTALALAMISLLLGSAPRLRAQNDGVSPQIRADNQVIREKFIRAYGHVEIIWQEYVIYADAVEYDQEKGELFAEGRVTMAGQDSVLSGEKMKFNLKTHAGELVDTYGLITPFIRYETDRLTQVDLQTLTFKRLDLSACAQIVPRWKITGRAGKIKKEKYVEMRDVVFHIKNIPVFYLPYLRYPLQEDGRSSGFLIPAVGKSSLRGFFVQSSFFWAMRPNLDLTLNLDYYQYLGLGLSEELRYLFRHASGSVRLFHLLPGVGVKADPLNPISTEDIDRLRANGSNFVLDMSHQQEIPFLNSQLTIASRLPGTPEALRYLDTGFERYNLMSFSSSLSWTSHVSIFTLNVAASRRELYNINSGESEKDDVLPSLSLKMQPQKLGPLPGQFSFSLDYDRQIRNGVAQTVQPDFVYGEASQTVRFDPAYSLELIQASWLKASLAFSAKNSFYARSRDPLSGDIIDEPVTVQYQTAQLDLAGPSFSRTFSGAKRSFLHVIEPTVTFSYASKATHLDRVLRVGDNDYTPSSTATFALVSRLWMKKSGEKTPPQELLLLKIQQSYYLDPETANRGMKINDSYPAFSDLSASLDFKPGPYFSLGAQAAYNHYQSDFNRRLYSVNFHADYAKADAPLSGGLYYRKYCNPYGPADHPSAQSMLGGNLRLKLANFPLSLSLEAEYDSIRKQFTGCYLKAVLDYQCITINANLSFYLLNGSLAHDYRFYPTLGNFGAVTPFF
jgi:LPS-assembly protein